MKKNLTLELFNVRIPKTMIYSNDREVPTLSILRKSGLAHLITRDVNRNSANDNQFHLVLTLTMLAKLNKTDIPIMIITEEYEDGNISGVEFNTKGHSEEEIFNAINLSKEPYVEDEKILEAIDSTPEVEEVELVEEEVAEESPVEELVETLPVIEEVAEESPVEEAVEELPVEEVKNVSNIMNQTRNNKNHNHNNKHNKK